MTPTLAGFDPANILLAVSVLLSVAFFVYGFNVLHLVIRAKKYNPAKLPPPSTKPTVAIHLPIYNEMYVVGRLIRACAAMAKRYGADRTKIYVIDDSNDETSAEVDRLASECVAEGLSFEVVRRGSRDGYKAGALQCALSLTKEEVVAVLDADFVPEDDFLDRTVPYLERDPTIGFVQGRWGHLDRRYNLITESAALGIDAHFLIEQQGRNGSGYLMNFNGSAGVLRAKAIREAGGWAPDTLAEDLDISYRMQLAGYRGVYLSDVEVPAELPPTISSLKRQQGRWARGSLQTAKKLLWRIRESENLTLGQKLEAAVHLTYYLVHPLMVASFLVAVMAALLAVNVDMYSLRVAVPPLPWATPGGPAGAAMLSLQIAPWAVFSVLVTLSTAAVIIYCIEAVRAQNLGVVGNAKRIAFMVFLGYGISISNSMQALGGLLFSGTGVFQRTPKYAISRRSETWRGKRYQLPLGLSTVLEAGALGLATLAIANAYLTSNFGIIPILLVYFLGYSFVFGLTLSHSLRSAGHRDF